MGETVTVQRYSRGEKAANRKSFRLAKAALLYTENSAIMAGFPYTTKEAFLLERLPLNYAGE